MTGLEQVFRDAWAPVVASTARLTRDLDLAEDCAQEAATVALERWPADGVPANPGGWLMTVARNLLINQQRRKEGVPLEEVSSAEVLASIDQNTVSDSAEVASLVNAALARMPREEARLLESFHYDRHKTAQLAEAYGTSERAIEGRLRRARERLRRELESTMKSLRGLA
jgi:RNA polymerase sigma-70 factor (ECF subfamily)